MSTRPSWLGPTVSGPLCNHVSAPATVWRALNLSDFFRWLARSRGLMHRCGGELLLDALEVIEPLDGVVEFGAFLLGELGFHFGNRLGEQRPIDVLHRGGDVGEHGEALVRH